MSWITALIDTYNAISENPAVMGKAELTFRDGKYVEKRPLTPPYHTLCMAKIKVELNVNGDFVRATAIEKQGQQYYIVPTTNDSETRTNGAEKMPFPLHEKLKNIVIDAPVDGYANCYMRALHAWVSDDSFTSLPAKNRSAVEAVYQYLLKGRLEEDIRRDMPNAKETDFILFFVDGLGEESNANLTENRDVWNAWIRYAKAHSHDEDIPWGMCYATGENCELMQKGPRSIVKQGNGAKLFSVQRGTDKYPSTGRFTYWGTYFEFPEDCMSIGREAVEKSTAMLRWLIDRQGWRPASSVEQVSIVWDSVNPLTGNNNLSIDTKTLYNSDPAFDDEDVLTDSYDTGKTHAQLIRKCRDGRLIKGISDISQKVIVMTLDVPSTARASIIYYNEFSADEFVANALAWHDDAGWMYWNGKKLVMRAPSVSECLKLALGFDYKSIAAKAALSPNITLEIMRCINNHNTILPYHIIKTIAETLTHTERWSKDEKLKEPQKYEGLYLTLACGLFRKYFNQKGINIMASLDENNNDRSYLYGRVLAYFERIERRGLRELGNDHETSASKMRAVYFNRPGSIAEQLMRKTKPYQNVLKDKGRFDTDAINELLSRIGTNDIDAPIDGAMGLMGYAAQMTAFREQWQNSVKTKEEDSDE